MLPDKARKYLAIALESAPLVQRRLLAPLGDASDVFDMRPDPDRFTLREMLAHLADWDEIFLERLRRTVAEPRPTLPDIDEGAIAAERRYAEKDPQDNLRRFGQNRAALVEFVRSVPTNQLECTALRLGLGEMSVEDQIVLVCAHDGYHAKQTADYLSVLS